MKTILSINKEIITYAHKIEKCDVRKNTCRVLKYYIVGNMTIKKSKKDDNALRYKQRRKMKIASYKARKRH